MRSDNPQTQLADQPEIVGPHCELPLPHGKQADGSRYWKGRFSMPSPDSPEGQALSAYYDRGTYTGD